MGKKASLKIDMGYDIDELDYFEQDFGNEDEEGDKFSTQKQQKSPKVVSMVTTQKTKFSKSSAAALSVKIYQQRPIGMASPFLSLILSNGHDMLVVQMAGFLNLRSIGAFGCVNKAVNQMLKADVLYHPSILPCIKHTLPNTSVPGMARRLAMESPLFRKYNTSNNDNIVHRNRILQCHIVHSELGTTFTHSILSGRNRVITISNSGEIVLHNCSKNSSRLVIHPVGPNVFLASAIHSKCCALLTMPAFGVRRYILSLFSTNRHHKVEILWQYEILVPNSFGRTQLSNPSMIQFDSDADDSSAKYVAVTVSNKVCVFTVNDGSLLWEHALEKQHRSWNAWRIHNRQYLVAYAKKKSLLIFDIEQKRLVASGRIPLQTKKQPPRSSHNVNCPIQIFQDCIWISCCPELLCTGSIFKRLERQQKLQQPVETPPILSIKKFQSVLSLTSTESIFRCYNRRLYVANGNVIRIYNNDNNTRHDDIPQPCQTLCTEATIEHFEVKDSIKIICAIQDGKKRSIEVLQQLQTNSSMWDSVLVKNAAIFCDRYQIHSLECRGNRLLVSYTRGEEYVSSKGELRVFNLADNEEDTKPE